MPRPRRAMSLALAMTLVAGVGLASCKDDASPEDARTLAPLPVARTEVGGAAWEGRIVVAGGLAADGSATDRVDIYDPAADRWAPGPPLPLALHHFGMATMAGRLYVAGGYSNQPQAGWQSQADVFSLGPREQAWRSEPPLSRPRGGLAMVAVGNRLVALGGVVGEGASATTEVLDAGAGRWRPGPAMGEARDHLAAASSGGRVYAIAGRVAGLETNKSSVESWAPGDPAWRPEPAVNDSRGGTSAADVGGRPCVAGGEEPSGTIASVECLAGGRWAEVSRLEEPRHGLAVVGLADDLHVVGGGPEPGLFVSPAHQVFALPK